MSRDESLQRWRVVHRRWKRSINEAEAPDANEEYLLYQTLLGTWPVQPSGEAEEHATSDYIERIQTYMTQARPVLAKGRQPAALFLSKRGEGIRAFGCQVGNPQSLEGSQMS